MIVVAEFYARYRTTISETELRTAGERILQFAENVVREHYVERFDDFGITITVRLEIGSTRIWITVKAVGKVLIAYGAIRQGVDYLVADSKVLAPKLIPRISTVLNVDERPLYHQRRFGLPVKLRRLFEQVQRGELSADEATAKAIDLMESQDATLIKEIPDFKERLSLEIRELAEPGHRTVRQEELFQSRESTAYPKLPERTPLVPERPDPIIAQPAGSRHRRQRRRGVILERDPKTGSIKLIPY